MATMRANVFEAKNKFRIVEVPRPTVRHGEALIRITLTTICGTDLHIVRGEYPVRSGLIIGHEPVGVVEELGPGVTGYQVGDRVLVGAITPCGQCRACLSGHQAQCGQDDGYTTIGGWRFGNTINGAQADYLVVPHAQANLAKIPDDLTDEQVQTMLRCEQGGMNEVLADVFAITGDRKYLALAKRFSHREILDPLLAKQDRLEGLHANTQIPKVIGFNRISETLPDAGGEYAAAARYFWRTVAMERSFVTGGHGDLEHFFPKTEFAAHLESGKTMETCCTHNMLRLTRALYARDPRVEFFDYFERALFNGILASQEQAAAAKAITDRWKFIDPSRIGIWGWSGGGSMTLNMMFRYPEIYKTGMSVAPGLIDASLSLQS